MALPRHVKANLQGLTSCPLIFASQLRQPMNIISHCHQHLPLLTCRLSSKVFPLWGVSDVIIQVLLRNPTREQNRPPRHPLHKLWRTFDENKQLHKSNFTVTPRSKLIIKDDWSVYLLAALAFRETGRIYRIQEYWQRGGPASDFWIWKILVLEIRLQQCKKTGTWWAWATMYQCIPLVQILLLMAQRGCLHGIFQADINLPCLHFELTRSCRDVSSSVLSLN